MNELLTGWSELLKQQQQQTGPRTGGVVQQNILEQLPVLQALRAAGCAQIPGEVFNVIEMIREREQLLQEIRRSGS